MKLGKILDLSKCFYKDMHWQHPDLKNGISYLINHNGIWCIGIFKEKAIWLKCDGRTGPSPSDYYWSFTPNGSEYNSIHLNPPLNKDREEKPFENGWKHIQEILEFDSPNPFPKKDIKLPKGIMGN